jgi:hypothetical protein
MEEEQKTKEGHLKKGRGQKNKKNLPTTDVPQPSNDAKRPSGSSPIRTANDRGHHPDPKTRDEQGSPEEARG